MIGTIDLRHSRIQALQSVDKFLWSILEVHYLVAHIYFVLFSLLSNIQWYIYNGPYTTRLRSGTFPFNSDDTVYHSTDGVYTYTSIQNALIQKSTCNPLIPFGECPIGEYEGQCRVESSTTYLQYSISFIVALLAGAWSDSHGRRRKPLIFLPIIGQISTDGLYFVNHFWYWHSTFNIIFTSVIPGLYVGRNMFWVGVISYVSENSKFECRTLKHGIIIVT